METCLECGDDVDVYAYIRHQLKNSLNNLVVAEYEKYGNNMIIKSMATDINMMINADFIKRYKHFYHK